MTDGRGPEWLEKRRDNRTHPPLLPSRDFNDYSEHDPLTRDVAFNRHSMNDGEHVSPTDNGEVQIGTDNIRVAIAQGIDVPQLKKTLSAAVRATVGLDMTQTLPGDWENCKEAMIWYRSQPDKENVGNRSFWDGFSGRCEHAEHKMETTSKGTKWFGLVPMEDWEEMLKGGLQTALETQTIVFAVGGVSRTATHQLVRSRRAAFHQQSQRASYMGDEPEVRMPESVWRNPTARSAFLSLVVHSWKTYQTLTECNISYQDARFALLEGTTNFILLEYPILEFLNVYAYRGCSMFQWEIVHVMRECRRLLVEAYPWIEPYVKISCEKTGPVDLKFSHGDPTTMRVEHHCTFQGWEDVEGQCPFPWARHEARTFKPQFHRISKKGGE